MFTGTLYNLSHSLKRQVINKTTYICAAWCGINAVVCRHSTVSADVRFAWKQKRQWGHGKALPLCLRVTPLLPPHQNQRPLQVLSLFYWKGLLNCLHFANQLLGLTMKPAVPQLVGCHWQGSQARKSARGNWSTHTAEEWVLRQAWNLPRTKASPAPSPQIK